MSFNLVLQGSGSGADGGIATTVLDDFRIDRVVGGTAHTFILGGRIRVAGREVQAGVLPSYQYDPARIGDIVHSDLRGSVTASNDWSDPDDAGSVGGGVTFTPDTNPTTALGFYVNRDVFITGATGMRAGVVLSLSRVGLITTADWESNVLPSLPQDALSGKPKIYPVYHVYYNFDTNDYITTVFSRLIFGRWDEVRARDTAYSADVLGWNVFIHSRETGLTYYVPPDPNGRIRSSVIHLFSFAAPEEIWYKARRPELEVYDNRCTRQLALGGNPVGSEVWDKFREYTVQVRGVRITGINVYPRQYEVEDERNNVLDSLTAVNEGANLFPATITSQSPTSRSSNARDIIQILPSFGVRSFSMTIQQPSRDKVTYSNNILGSNTVTQSRLLLLVRDPFGGSRIVRCALVLKNVNRGGAADERAFILVMLNSDLTGVTLSGPITVVWNNKTFNLDRQSQSGGNPFAGLALNGSADGNIVVWGRGQRGFDSSNSVSADFITAADDNTLNINFGTTQRGVLAVPNAVLLIVPLSLRHYVYMREDGSLFFDASFPEVDWATGQWMHPERREIARCIGYFTRDWQFFAKGLTNVSKEVGVAPLRGDSSQLRPFLNL